MARRKLTEINAGSMADIAFLLLVFFLMVTTIDSDMGILRQLPPPVPPDMVDIPPVKERNVYVVLVNANNQLLVEGEYMNIRNLKDGAKEFLIANGVFEGNTEKEHFPVRTWVRRSVVEENIAKNKGYMLAAANDNERKAFQSELDKWEQKLIAIDLLGQEYKELPPSALISMQNDNGTSYDTYIQVQNELESAVNELRDELSMQKFNMTYAEMEDRFKREPNNELIKKRIFAVRAVYPQRISEAEPKDAGKIY